MTQIGSYEAKTQLPRLLRRVGRGEKIVITRRGRPIAVLVPVTEEATELEEVIQEMRELRKGNVLGEDLTVRQLIEEGRR